MSQSVDVAELLYGNCLLFCFVYVFVLLCMHSFVGYAYFCGICICNLFIIVMYYDDITVYSLILCKLH